VKAAGVIVAVGAVAVVPQSPGKDQMKYEASLDESAALIKL